MLSDKQLRRWYREYNQRWFSGELPESIDILYAPITGCLGDVIDCPAEDFIIRINPQCAFDTRMVRMILLHEMAHVAVWPYAWHGGKFQDEMQRLAALGAFKGLW